MRKVMSAVAALFVMSPLFGAGALQAGAVAAPAEESRSAMSPMPSQRCCWVYYMGMWRCLPC